MITIKDFGDALIYVGAVAIALGAIGGVLNYVVVRPLKRWMADQITQRVAMPLDKVQHEVTANGDGRGSVKDQLGRLDAKVTLLSQRFDKHLESHSWHDKAS